MGWFHKKLEDYVASGYEIGTAARAAGAMVVYGGIHATLYPDEAQKLERPSGLTH